MVSKPHLPQQAVAIWLRTLTITQLALDTERAADDGLAIIAACMRGETGPRECGCGGCDSCAQHAIIDWLEPPG